ncbi:MAG: biopolymer transporter ExbD [Candidatus Hydrogenedentota bacterium]|jgi:biopolymer transport protein TolR|uniref:Biopolymer transport protein ExbD/TolR n=1 Tax=Sumerlaea chitinivorans TaxID=2250252 RepID=A0A2Z4Y9K5_SUMC1|nr:Biopolymer transport protein ExbD/TolR [Candidatus Sumerlaea chitinivorans]RMH26069.1 MAG: biopolymer transporter ExbD [Candidatus Hydrogenedentota bacterium]
MRRHHKDLAPISQINLTSLLDVTFVLLIAFMIVAPALKYGIDLDLPTVQEGAPQLTQNQTQLFTIVVPKPSQSEQQFFLNDEPVTLRDIEMRLRLQRENGRMPSVEIQADRDVPYDIFIQVVAALRRAGIEAVGLPVEAGRVTAPNRPASGASTLAEPMDRPEGK